MKITPLYSSENLRVNLSPESKFPDEYSGLIFIQIDQHLKKLLQKNTKESRFYESRTV